MLNNYLMPIMFFFFIGYLFAIVYCEQNIGKGIVKDYY